MAACGSAWSDLWKQLERALGADLLSSLTGYSTAGHCRRASAARVPSDALDARMRFLASMVEDLTGAYSAAGVRGWFRRRRTQLGGLTPAALLLVNRE